MLDEADGDEGQWPGWRDAQLDDKTPLFDAGRWVDRRVRDYLTRFIGSPSCKSAPDVKVGQILIEVVMDTPTKICTVGFENVCSAFTQSQTTQQN